jgi:hypothetical protein
MRARIAALVLFTTFAAAIAADPKFTPSKITYAKKNSWEAIASRWMGSNELKNYVEDQKKNNKQMIFVDYNGAQYRGLFSEKIKFKGWFHVEVFSEKAMAGEISYYKKRGMEPTYIYKNAGGYTSIFTTPEQVSEARKLLEELGIGPCTVKE